MSAAVHIEGELTVFTVHSLKERLLAALGQGEALRIDLSGVSEVDGAGVQLLLATRREAQQRGVALALLAPAPALMAALELTDLAREWAELIQPETEPAA